LNKAKSDDDIKKAILKSYTQIEDDWYNVAKTSFGMGYPKSAYVGSCALTVLVHDNKLYTANAGDSKACILRKKADGSYERIKLSKTFNANKKYEQERLKA
jgi:serine/threonine protein phosphatase PrpC